MTASRYLQFSSVTEGTYHYIRDLILTGQFMPGQRLRERELTERTGVSRTPIREALRMLEQEQLLILESRKGFRIPVPTKKEITDFYELRAELEGLAAAKAAHKSDRARLTEIAGALSTAEESLRNEELSQVISLNNWFHDLVSMASGNESLSEMLSKLRAKVNLFRALSWSERRERPAETLRQHHLIFNAIQARNEASARSRAMDHVMDSLPLALDGLKSIHPADEG